MQQWRDMTAAERKPFDDAYASDVGARPPFAQEQHDALRLERRRIRQVIHALRIIAEGDQQQCGADGDPMLL